MMMYRRGEPIMVFLLLFFPLYTRAQASILLKETGQHVYIFDSRDDIADKQANNIYFLKTLSQSNPDFHGEDHYSFRYTLRTVLTKVRDDLLNLKVELYKGGCSGLVRYRGFDLSESMEPDMVSMTVRLLLHGREIRSYECHDVDISGDTSEIANIDIHDPGIDMRFTVINDHVFFYSGDIQGGNFVRHLTLVNDYYGTQQLIRCHLDRIGEGFERYSADFAWMLLLLYESDRLQRYIHDKGFEHNLEVFRVDSSNWKQVTDSLELRASLILTNLRHVIQDSRPVDMMNFPAGYARRFTGLTDGYLQRSRLAGYQSAPVFVEIAAIRSKMSSLTPYYTMARRIMMQSGAGRNAKVRISSFTRLVMQGFLSSAMRYISSESYNNALVMLENASLVEKTCPGAGTSWMLFGLMSKARYGIYQSYLTIAEKAIRMENYEIAEKHITLAKTYQEQNRAYIISDIGVRNLYENLITLSVKRGEELNEEGSYEKALECLRRAEHLSYLMQRYNFDIEIKRASVVAKNGIYQQMLDEAENLLANNDAVRAAEVLRDAGILCLQNRQDIAPSSRQKTLAGRTNQTIYDNLIGDGLALLAAGEGSYAVEKFNLARKMETAGIGRENPDLGLYLLDAGRLMLRARLANANLFFLLNDSDTSRIIYNSILESQKHLDLTGDTEIKAQLTNLRKNLFHKECQELQVEFEGYYRKARQSYRLKDFVTSIGHFDRAVSLYSGNPNCDLADSSIFGERGLCALLASYQSTLLETSSSFGKLTEQQLRRKYIFLETLYNNHKIVGENYPVEPMEQLFMLQRKPGAVILALRFFIIENRHKDALRFMKHLERKNFPSEYTRKWQELLAVRLAFADRRQGNGYSPKQLLNKYSNQSRWFSYFNRSYMKAWKQAPS
jgi:hypothetical protein